MLNIKKQNFIVIIVMKINQKLVLSSTLSMTGVFIIVNYFEKLKIRQIIPFMLIDISTSEINECLDIMIIYKS